MSQGFEIIRARVKDDAVVLIDRLMRSRQNEVVLILPKNSIISADLNSLKILKEEAESIGKMLSIRTEDSKIKAFASEIGMKIYNPDNLEITDNLETTNKTKKIKIMMDILPPSLSNEEGKEAEEDVTDEISESLPELSKELEPDSKFLEPKINIYEVTSKNSDLDKNIENFYEGSLKENSLKLKNRSPIFSLSHLLIFFVISGFLLFGAAIYLILPKAEIKISLKEFPLKIQIPVAVTKNINSPDFVSNIIPGQYFLLGKAGSKSVETSPKAGGIIEIYNAYSALPQKLIAQTRFETKDGKIFRIQNPIMVPGAKMSGTKLIPSSIKANVVADKVGKEYLIEPSFFTITGFKETPKYAGFYAKSLESMTIVENAAISKEELDKNKKELQDNLVQELKFDTLSTLKDSDLQLIDGASKVLVEDFKVNRNNISMKITWEALFFKERDLRALINYFVSSRYPDLKKFTFEDKIAYPKASRADFKKGEFFFVFDINKDNALGADVEILKKELAGHDEKGMREIVSDKTYINSATISLWPFWVKSAPNNLNKINITVDPNH